MFGGILESVNHNKTVSQVARRQSLQILKYLFHKSLPRQTVPRSPPVRPILSDRKLVTRGYTRTEAVIREGKRLYEKTG